MHAAVAFNGGSLSESDTGWINFSSTNSGIV
jgi:hypothetical protein